MKTICIFCGARKGSNTNISKFTYLIGQEIAKNDARVLCGGSDIGLMKILTDGAVSKNGEVIGVFPAILDNVEVPYKDLTKLIHTPCLPSRKQKMIDMSDVFLILPGGYGTLDEIFEVLVLRRLNANKKPIILFNFDGFYNPMIAQLKRMVAEGFIGDDEADLLVIANNFEEVICNIRELL